MRVYGYFLSVPGMGGKVPGTAGDTAPLGRRAEKYPESRNLRIRLEQGGLKWAETFNWDNAADKFNKLLNEIVEPGK